MFEVSEIRLLQVPKNTLNLINILQISLTQWFQPFLAHGTILKKISGTILKKISGTLTWLKYQFGPPIVVKKT